MRMLYPGSFDPITNGHMDIITRASRMCEELVVAVMHNPDKRGAFPVEARVKLLERACAALENVRVMEHGGLMVECAKEQEVSCVVRGVRPLGDFEAEYGMAQVNRMIGGVETLLMPTTPEHADISSSIVRQIAMFGGEIDRFVPEGLAEDIRAVLSGNGELG